MKKQRTKRFTKASFKKWKRENPEEFRKVYGPWTSLEATLIVLRGVVHHFSFMEDGSDVLGYVPFEPIDDMEFVCAFAAECGYAFSQPLCDTINIYMRKGSRKTVKDLSAVIERAFCEDGPKERLAFVDDGENCRHFEIRDSYAEDTRLCEDEGTKFSGQQQCYLCRHWDISCDGCPCDCTTGKCTYKWQDPNGDRQGTFWEEK